MSIRNQLFEFRNIVQSVPLSETGYPEVLIFAFSRSLHVATRRAALPFIPFSFGKHPAFWRYITCTRK